MRPTRSIDVAINWQTNACKKCYITVDSIVSLWLPAIVLAPMNYIGIYFSFWECFLIRKKLKWKMIFCHFVFVRVLWFETNKCLSLELPIAADSTSIIISLQIFQSMSMVQMRIQSTCVSISMPSKSNTHFRGIRFVPMWSEWVSENQTIIISVYKSLRKFTGSIAIPKIQTHRILKHMKGCELECGWHQHIVATRHRFSYKVILLKSEISIFSAKHTQTHTKRQTISNRMSWKHVSLSVANTIYHL